MDARRYGKLLPPPVPRRRFHAGSADVPAPAAGGAEHPASAAGRRVGGVREAGRSGAGLLTWVGASGFPYTTSRRPALMVPGERGRTDGGTVPNSFRKPVTDVRVKI